MYTVYNTENIQHCSKIMQCKDYNKHIKISLSVILFIIAFIFLNGLFPTPVMNLLKSAGLIEYTEIHNVHIAEGYRGFTTIKGIYKDSNGQHHNASISVMAIFDSSYLRPTNKNEMIVEAAYYTFLPSYDLLRHPQFLGILFVYGLLVYTIYWGGSAYYRKHKILKNTEFMTLIRPIGINSEAYTKTGNTPRYKTCIVWETPNGPCFGNPETLMSKTITKYMNFPHEYCACYLRTTDGEEMIVTEQNYSELEKYSDLKMKLKKLKKEQAAKISKESE